MTTHQYHAQEFVRAAELGQYEGIASVGGDGMLSEVRIPLCAALSAFTLLSYVILSSAFYRLCTD